MTSDEIKKRIEEEEQLEPSPGYIVSNGHLSLKWLREIAYQLAKLNEKHY